MKFHAECPGVFTKDFSETKFAVFVVATVDPRAYYNDEPLLLRSLKPGYDEGIGQNPTIYINGHEIQSIPELPSDVVANIEETIEKSKELSNTIEKIASGDLSDIPSMDCPPNDDNYQTEPNDITFNIEGPGGEVIQTITKDLNSRETSNCSEINVDDLIATFLNDVPDMPRVVEKNDMNVVCTLPDSVIKEKLRVSEEAIVNLVGDFNLNSYESIINSTQEVSNDLWSKMGFNTNEIPSDWQEWFADQIQGENTIQENPVDQWYGIPLIELHSGVEGDGTDAVILQINTKYNWKLELLNFGMLFDDPNFKLEINEEAPIPGVKFIAGFITDGIQHTIVLRNLAPGHETLSKTITKPKTFSINSFGTDTRQIKNLCGVIHDIYLWNWAIPEDVEVIKDQVIQPPFPFGALAFYDFHITRVIQNMVHEIRGLLKPVRIGGVKEKEWTLFDDSISETWRFMINGYLDNFFCRKKFLRSSFSIVWYHQVENFGVGIQYIISDDINHNYLYYDYDNLEFVLKFNNKIFRWFFIMPSKRWMQYNLRYDQANGIIYIGAIDFESGLFFGKSFDIGANLEFELMSMLAKYNPEKKAYEQKFNCAFGMLMLFDKFMEDSFLNKYFLEEKPVIEELKPFD